MFDPPLTVRLLPRPTRPSLRALLSVLPSLPTSLQRIIGTGNERDVADPRQEDQTRVRTLYQPVSRAVPDQISLDLQDRAQEHHRPVSGSPVL